MSSAPRRRARMPYSLGRAFRRQRTRRRPLRRWSGYPGDRVSVDVKFCGLTRAEDADYAASLGAAYIGVSFAESRRRVEPAVAATVVTPARGRAKVVGVFGADSIEAVTTVANDLSLD